LAELPQALRILFVDDNRDDVELECRELARDGLAFEWRATYKQAELERLLDEFDPHVVLCDYSIPGFSGRAALAIVKQRKPLVPLIFVSGTIGEETAVECLREGATDYVLKNNPRRLGSAVRRALAEVEERRLYEARIRHLANFDALTDLPNRTLLGDRIEQAIVHAGRSGGIVALLVMNIDGFRRVNEGFGHGEGDAVLRQVAARLQGSVRIGDTVARSGGDEFTALIADLDRPEDVNPFVWRLLDAVQVPLRVQDRSVAMTATAGVALFPADGADSEALLRAGVAAMHTAKARQRGGFVFAGSADAMRDSVQRVMLESGLSQALRRNEIRLLYQVQHDLATERPCGLEALMRWGEGDRLVPPQTFIPIAEETGLIRQLGRWALREACATALAWVERDPSLVLGVNVSALQLQEDGFIEHLETVLGETGFPARALELELTETALMKGEERAVRTIEGLRRTGVRLAIDDFGTGYSSLSYLSRLPIERLKIDASFVQRMTEDARDAKIAHSIVSLGHGLGLKVIAEGVEPRAQLDMLRRMECDQVQGFLFSAPSRAEEVSAALEAAGRG
jgi:diguanylate cyclase (GGDEF)-like protein